jgi:uncharacterized protein (TIGR02117 family)
MAVMRKWGLALAGAIFAVGQLAAADCRHDVCVAVVSNGWHTGVVVAQTDLPADRLPEVHAVGQAPFIEFGWGDAEYYPTKNPTWTMAMRAAVVPSPAVLHVAWLPAAPRVTFPTVESVTIGLNAAQFERLIVFIDGTFARDGDEAKAWSAGLYPFSRFHPANGSFHLFNTCNIWVARALVAAGQPLTLANAHTADGLMAQLRSLPTTTK